MNFKHNIDLIDETLREGSERSPYYVDLNTKVELAKQILDSGVRSIVVGMFPDVPENIELLKELLRLQKIGEISKNKRFIIISHLGKRFHETNQILEEFQIESDSVWILAIHGASSEQIKYLFPKIFNETEIKKIKMDDWLKLNDSERKQINFKWFENFISGNKSKNGSRIMLGLLDYFRSDLDLIDYFLSVAVSNNISQIRLVDSAGTCRPDQLETYVEQKIKKFSMLKFYGHFHNDFGIATSNALIGLSMGMQGVDVSLGGFANRAGHPALAEIAYGLKKLYNQDIPYFKYENLFKLSRKVEQVYGLIESPTTPVTGVITSTTTTGIRTELEKICPDIFDITDAHEIGTKAFKTFGIRSGLDGLKRFIKENRFEVKEEEIPEIYKKLVKSWSEKSTKRKERARNLISEYQKNIKASLYTEDEILETLNSLKGRKHEHITSNLKINEGNLQ